MKSLSLFAALILMAQGALLGASRAESRAETSTYIEGTVAGFTPNTGGTFVIGDTLQFKSEAGSVIVPFDRITKAELSAVRTKGTSEPLFKVWALHKRWVGRTKTQYLTVRFLDEQNAEKSMTVELPQDSAGSAMDTIETRAGKKPAASPANGEGEWWGDRYWKTNRNADKWARPVAGGAN